MGICLHHVEAIDLSSLIPSLYVVKEGDTYPVMDSPIHGNHYGAGCNSVLHCVHKLVVFVSTCIFLPMLVAQIDLSVVATL